VTAIILGVGAGFGILCFGAALRGHRRALPAALFILDADPVFESTENTNTGQTGRDLIRSQIRLWLGARASVAMNRAPSIGDAFRRDLASTGWSVDSVAERCLLSSVAGAILPFAVWSLMLLRGIEVPLVLPVWVGLIGGSAGAALPIIVMRRAAKNARRQARRMVGCFLDLVVLALAGGLGIEGALHAAAAIGDTRVSHQLVRCLDEARDAGRTPWEALERLGHGLVVPELVELSSAVSLAGTEGARIKSTLAAKAASIRRHELADAERDANTISERLFIPGVLLLVGFLIFIGYPAVARLSEGL
jgi:Flp pilus assembly protein TadB